MKIKNLGLQFAVALTAVFALSACEDKPETAGEKLDSMIQSTKDAAEDASDKAKEMTEEACEKANEELETKMDC